MFHFTADEAVLISNSPFDHLIGPLLALTVPQPALPEAYSADFQSNFPFLKRLKNCSAHRAAIFSILEGYIDGDVKV
jgi:hypothetical protein